MTIDECCNAPEGSFETFIKAQQVAMKLQGCRVSVEITREEIGDLLEQFPDLKEFCRISVC